MKVFQGHEAGEQGEHPGKANHVEIDHEFLEPLVEVMDVDLEVGLDSEDVIVALFEA